MPADRSDRPWCLDLRELRPRGGPAFGGFRPPLQWLRPGPSDGPDPVEVPAPADLVLRSPVRDGDLIEHVPNPSCSSPPLCVRQRTQSEPKTPAWMPAERCLQPCCLFHPKRGAVARFRQHMLTNTESSAYADDHGTRTGSCGRRDEQ